MDGFAFVRRRPLFERKMNGDGQNMDILFLAGKVDVDTCCRYLKEFARTSRHGYGKKAVGRMVDGLLKSIAGMGQNPV